MLAILLLWIKGDGDFGVGSIEVVEDPPMDPLKNGDDIGDPKAGEEERRPVD